MLTKQKSLSSLNEEWRDVIGFEGLYKISSLGRLMGFQRHKKWTIMSPGALRGGYHNKTLYHNKRYSSRNMARMVATAFIDNPENKPMINHINGIKTDNRVENLEWVTASENTQHAYDIGLKIAPHGEKHCRAKLTEDDIKAIRASHDKKTNGHAALSRKFGVCASTIERIVKGKYWKHLL